MVLLLSNGYVSTKLEVSVAFIFRENRMHGTDRQTDRQMDGVQRLMHNS